MKKSQK